MFKAHFFDKKELKFVYFVSFLFFIFLFSNYIVNYKLLKDAIQAYESTILARVDGKLSDWIDDRFTNIEKIQVTLEKSSLSNKQELQQALKQIQATSSFPYIIIGLYDGSFLISEDNFVTPVDYDPRRREWYVDTLKMKKTIVTKPYVSMRLSLPAVSVCTPIKLFKGDGVVCGGQPFEVIQQYISSYDLLYDKALYLVDEHGIVLASSNHHKNSPDFLNIKVLDKEEYTILKIKNAPWDLVFEKNKALYSDRLNSQLLLNLFLYGISIILYIMVNLYWFSKNRKVSYELAKQKEYLNDFMQNHTIRGITIFDATSKIIFANQMFYTLLKTEHTVENKNFYDLWNALTHLNFAEKEAVLERIKQTEQDAQIRYYNLTNPSNTSTKLLVTIAPFGTKNNHSLLLSLQDTTDIQTAEILLQEDDATVSTYNAYIEKLLMFIERNLDDESLDINKLAHVSGYSKYHLQRIFKNYCNENIASYLRRLRMEKSAFLLKYTDNKVSVITSLCGFGYNQTYIRAFEKHYDCSPSDFREFNQSQKHNFRTFDLNEYMIIEREALTLLVIHNIAKENVVQSINDFSSQLAKEIHALPHSIIGIYSNDPKVSLKDDDNALPYAYGLVLEDTLLESYSHYPLKKLPQSGFLAHYVHHFDSPISI